MRNVGWHTSIKFLLEQDDEFYKIHNTFQVFVGSPRTLKFHSFENLYKLKKLRPELDIVVHTPYVVSLCKNPAESIAQLTMRYYIELSRNMDKCGVKYMVSHIGGLTKGETIKQGAVYIYDFCMRWLSATSGSNVVLCLENDSGSKSGTKMGFIKILAAIVKKINSPRIRMCYDLNHAYGAGFDILSEEKLEKIINYIDVVHFNAIPSYVEFGSHLDRHSTTSLDESVVDEYNIFKKLNNGNRLFIFEVEGEPYISRNFNWLEDRRKENELEI